MKPIRTGVLGAAAFTLVLTAAACGNDDSTESTAESGDPSSDVADAASGIEVSGPWARTSAMNQANGAVYMTLVSDTDTAVVAASVPAEIAARVELHETVMADMDDGEMSDDTDDGEMSDDTDDGEMSDDMDDGEMSDDMDMDGMDGGAMTMQEVAQLVLPAGESVALEPGGLHVMLFELASPLEDGQSFTVTLEFEDGSTLPVDVTVGDEAP